MVLVTQVSIQVPDPFISHRNGGRIIEVVTATSVRVWNYRMPCRSWPAGAAADGKMMRPRQMLDIYEIRANGLSRRALW